MFQQIALLCFSAVLNAAKHHEHSQVWGGSIIKNNIPLRYNTSEQNFSGNLRGTRSDSGDEQLNDSAWSYDNFGLTQNTDKEKSTPYPRKRIGVDEQETTNKYREKKPKYAGRGLFNILSDSVKREGLIYGLEDTVEQTLHKVLGLVDDAATITQDLVRGSDKVTDGIVADSVKLTGTVVEGSLNITKKAIDWAKHTMQIGTLMITAPLRRIELTTNAVWADQKLSTGLAAQIISDTAGWFQGDWSAVKATEFQGKPYIFMSYPSGLMSVVNQATKEIMYMLEKGRKILSDAFGYTLYVSLKVVFGCVTKVLESGGFDCIELNRQDFKVDRMVVGAIHTENGKACGISHLKPENNVTIRSSDETFLIIETPWVLEDVSVNLTGVRVTGGGEILLDGETLETTIKKIKATGTISFEAGTLLRFVKIHMQVDDMEGFNVQFPTQHKSYLMEYIEALSEYFTGLLRNKINNALGTIEKKVFDYIATI